MANKEVNCSASTGGVNRQQKKPNNHDNSKKGNKEEQEGRRGKKTLHLKHNEKEHEKEM